MILDSLFPVFALLVAGHLLKRFGLTNDIFLKTSDRLVYYLFFPAMLFWKIGGAAGPASVNWQMVTGALAAVGIIFLLSLAIIRIGRVPAFQAGTFSQSCYRFNTYIGMAVAITAYGEPGGRLFGILIGFSIPVINVLAVSILIWYSKVDYGSRRRLMMTAKALFSNPLIIACVAGLLYARTGWGFAGFLENTFRLASLVTLPLALISIGGALKLKRLGGFFRLSLTAAVVKLAIYPLIGAVTLHFLAVTGLPQHVAMLFFCLPASPQIYVLSSQLDSDTELASAAIVLSTIASFLSLSVALSL